MGKFYPWYAEKKKTEKLKIVKHSWIATTTITLLQQQID